MGASVFESNTARRVLDATRLVEAGRGGSVLGDRARFEPDVPWRVAEVVDTREVGSSGIYEVRWAEIEWDEDNDEWQTKVGGMTSVIDTDNWARAAIPASGTNGGLADGVRILVWPANNSDNETRWLYITCLPDLLSAKITSVTGTTNATYNAQAIADSSIAVTGATPVDRDLTGGDYSARSANDEEGVYLQRLSDGSLVLLANEKIGNSTCTTGGVAAVAGAIWINSASSSAVADEAAVTDFDIVHVITAGTLIEGNLYRVTAIGELDVNASTDSVAFQLRLANSAIHTVTAKRPGADDRRFAIVWLIDIRTSEETYVTCERSQVGSAEGYEIQDNGGTFDETVDNDLEVAVDWTTASANNSAVLNTFLVERLL